MKTKSHYLVVSLRWLTEVMWYLNFLVIALFIFLFAKEYLNQDYYYFNQEVTISLSSALTDKQTINSPDFIENAKLLRLDGRLMMNVKNSPANTLLIISYLILLEALIIVVLYSMRKLFKSLKEQKPFTTQNIKSLKIIALSILTYFPLDWLAHLVNESIASSLEGYGEFYALAWQPKLWIVLLSVVIYILANIFQYGLKLDEENKQFV